MSGPRRARVAGFWYSPRVPRPRLPVPGNQLFPVLVSGPRMRLRSRLAHAATAGRPAGKPTCQTRDMDHVRELVVKGPHRCGAKSHEAAVGVVRQPRVSCEQRSPAESPGACSSWRVRSYLGQERGMMMAGNFSVATIAALSKIVRTCRNLRHVIGREPTAEEIAGRLRMPPETIRKLLEASPPLAPH